MSDIPQQHKDLIFFVDRSLPKGSLPEALRKANVNVIYHDEVFPSDTEDEVWLKHAGKKGWVVLTHDKKIGNNPLEIKALRDANVKAFVLTSKGSLLGVELCSLVINALTSIQNFAIQHPSPFISKIYRDGSVKKWR